MRESPVSAILADLRAGYGIEDIVVRSAGKLSAEPCPTERMVRRIVSDLRKTRQLGAIYREMDEARHS